MCRVSYQVSPKFSNLTRRAAHVQCGSSEDQELVNQEAPTIMSLTKGSQSVTAVARSQDVPTGCISEIVASDLVVHILVKVRLGCRLAQSLADVKLGVQGKIDVDAETNKINKKKVLAESTVDKMKSQAAAPEYETKIPLAVREKNADKLKDLQSEIETMNESLVSLPFDIQLYKN